MCWRLKLNPGDKHEKYFKINDDPVACWNDMLDKARLGCFHKPSLFHTVPRIGADQIQVHGGLKPSALNRIDRIGSDRIGLIGSDRIVSDRVGGDRIGSD